MGADGGFEEGPGRLGPVEHRGVGDLHVAEVVVVDVEGLTAVADVRVVVAAPGGEPTPAALQAFLGLADEHPPGRR